MRRIIVFNHVTLDGYFTDANSSMNWAHGKEDAEWNAFVAENAEGGGELLFGRITYELMASFLADPAGAEDPAGRGRPAERPAEGRVLTDASQCGVEQHDCGER